MSIVIKVNSVKISIIGGVSFTLGTKHTLIFFSSALRLQSGRNGIVLGPEAKSVSYIGILFSVTIDDIQQKWGTNDGKLD